MADNGSRSDSSAPTADAASLSLEQRLASIWAGVFGLAHVGLHDSLFDLGGDWISAKHVLGAVETEFGERLPMSALLHAPTVAQFAARLRGKDRSESGNGLVLVQRGSAQPPFFYAPGAAIDDTVLLGYSAYLTAMARRLGESQAVHSLYQEHSGVAVSVESVAANLVRDIRAAQATGPYHLGGWSLGGLVAYEIARQLSADGEEVALLMLIDTGGPGDLWTKTRMGRFTGALHAWREMSLPRKLIHPAGVARDFVSRCAVDFRYWLKRVIYPHKPRDPWARLEKIESDYLSVNRHYRGRLTLFASEEFSVAASGDAAIGDDPLLGWGRVAGSVEVRKLPGNHFTIFDDPGLTEIVKFLRERLPRQEPAASESALGGTDRGVT